jgi:hypothetical protein
MWLNMGLLFFSQTIFASKLRSLTGKPGSAGAAAERGRPI